MDQAHIGTSGFGIARAKYFQLFSCVEVQHTFYQPPTIAPLERWRATAPPNFEFVLKAWQLITHDARSPTYRRLRRKLSEVEKREAGYFRPTAIVEAAWEVTLACANALKAKTILFQCPASFSGTKENISHLTSFFSRITRNNAAGEPFNFCWEPRGDWEPEVVKGICDDLSLWHAVDPFMAGSVTPNKLYWRLHGRKGWRYEYDEAELHELAALLMSKPPAVAAGPRPNGQRLTGTRNIAENRRLPKTQTAYVFFNNARMIQDAATFKGIIQNPER
jgi:uncharacterized protein YecE (DUF72 family)